MKININSYKKIYSDYSIEDALFDFVVLKERLHQLRLSFSAKNNIFTTSFASLRLRKLRFKKAVFTSILFFVTFFAFFSNNFSYANESIVMDTNSAKSGQILLIDGKIFTYQDKNASSNVTKTVKFGKETFDITYKDMQKPGNSFMVPVGVTDKALAEGVRVPVLMADGKIEYISIPRQRDILFPSNMYIPIADAGQIGNPPGRLVLGVVPIITKRLNITWSDTADKGLVINYNYSGQVGGSIYDTTNRLHKQDYSFWANFNNTHISDQYVLGKADPTVGYIEQHVPIESYKGDLSKIGNNVITNVSSDIRLDYSKARERRTLIGANFDWDTKNAHYEWGYFDSIMFTKPHFAWRWDLYKSKDEYNPEYLGLYGRLDNFDFTSQRGSVSSFSSNTGSFTGGFEKFGAMVEWDNFIKNTYLRIGSIHLDPNDDFYMRADRHLNTNLEYETIIGRPVIVGIDSNRFGGYVYSSYYTVGKNSWINLRLDLDYYLGSNWIIRFRGLDDNLRTGGRAVNAFWERRSLYLMKYADILNKKDILNRFGLDFIFSEVEFSKSESGAPFNTKYYIGFTKTIPIPYPWIRMNQGFRFTVGLASTPIEFYAVNQKSDSGNGRSWSFGATLSIMSF
ncbi:hypothetical protein TDSAC_1258 [Thermodesulfobium acidiphilum]|uniref:Uncharacterized protein n=2 Tax=Thermodesulfobium acidiphilum TaxID=1794699 RepID=A0A2R4W1M1_THEAF|nr:hypothetical protein TDSAC_1258 [Thermodesulfobium acidiphilum]